MEEAATPPRRDGQPLASPLARRTAKELGVDLAAVKGSGAGGRIRRADIVAHVPAPLAQPIAPPRPAPASAAAGAGTGPIPDSPRAGTGAVPSGYEDVPYRTEALSPRRRAIAARLTESLRISAHVAAEVEVDMTATTSARAALNTRRLAAGRPKASYLPFVARAICVAAADFPRLNATWTDDELLLWQQVNISVAVDSPDGLVVPVIRSCELASTAGLADALTEVTARARAGALAPDDSSAGTITLSNPGAFGAVNARAILNQPQVAVVGCAAIAKRPVVLSGPHGDAIAVRPVMPLAVTFDHRAVDGGEGTAFANRIKHVLESWSDTE
jgi:2-oxoglutarate dehydrogenase E2 component (dihydrolipoamide succinyltransferase)